MENNILELRPQYPYALGEELCFFVGNRVADRFEEVIEDLKDELLSLEYICVSSHVVRDETDFFIFVTSNFQIFADRTENNNFQVKSIKTGREFQASKKYLYNQVQFCIVLKEGLSVVLYNTKYTSCSEYYNDWGMTPESMDHLCEAIDDFMFNESKKTQNRVNLKFDKQVLQPIRNFTYYEDLAEQINAYGDNYVDYDWLQYVGGGAKKKTYDFFSRSFDSDSTAYQIGDRVAVDTTEEINDELHRKLMGTIADRTIEDEVVRFRIDFTDQFDIDILQQEHGHIYLQANKTQKRVRERVIKNIVNGTVDSEYMYQLFSKYKTEGYEEQEGWDKFHEELMKQKFPPNKSQMEAIKKGIETKDIQLVLGPPGTGKTTVIVSWVKYFINHGKRVLVSSQNNSAVDNVLERVGKDPAARVIRLGNIDKIQENCKQYSTDWQIDKTADEYMHTLDNSYANVNHDIEAVERIIQVIDSTAEDFRQLKEYYSALAAFKNEIYQKASDIVNNHKLSSQYYKSYNESYEELMKKYIYLYAVKKKGLVKRLLLMPVTFRIKREAVKLLEGVKEFVAQYLQSVEQYNKVSGEFQQILRRERYIEIKRNLSVLREKCSAYDFRLAFDGPFEVPDIQLDSYATAYDNIQSYKLKLVDVYKQLTQTRATLDDWRLCFNSKRNEIVTKLLIQNSNIVGATCIGINTRRQFQELQFDVSIIDESGQIQVHNAIVPMSRAPKTLMLGDHLQIPPMANETVVKLCKQDGIKTDLLEMSFFEYLFTKLEGKDPDTPNLTRLDEQFRMPGNISDVISDWFYNGNYHAHYDMSKWQPIIKGTTTPLIIISTSRNPNRFEDNPDKCEDKSPGYCNQLEAEIVTNIVATVFKGQDKPDSEQIGVISAYGKQVRLIRKKIKEKGIGLSGEQIHSIVASLDSFQGQERPLIVYSSTRSTDYKSPKKARVGFMKELRRLNVAFTRCQKQLVIIGDFDYLTTCEYEELDPETGTPLPNKSEKKYAEFMQKMVDQATSGKGEFYYIDDFYQKVGL